MPHARTIQTIHIGQRSSIRSMNEQTDPRPGELGGHIMVRGSDEEYQKIQLDSGAVAATPTGVVAAGQLAYWKSKGPNYIVTNDFRVAIGGESASTNNKRNAVAGVFTAAMTAGYFGVIQVGGNYPTVVTDGGNDGKAGDYVIASATSAQADAMAAGTAPTNTTIGKGAGAEAASAWSVDLNVERVW